MNIEETSTLLGYQLRQPMNKIATQWSQVRRGQYLLNPGIKFPLSADKAVWPISDDPDICNAFFEDFDPSPFSAPNGLNIFNARFNAQLPGGISNKWTGVLIALTASRMRAEVLRAKHFILEQPRALTELGLVGFDVCDDYLTSGLSNCGIAEDERFELQRKFGGLLNQFGLFKNSEDATDYAHAINEIVREHAPFDWIGLYTREIK
jgi:hypothetical protein